MLYLLSACIPSSLLGTSLNNCHRESTCIVAYYHRNPAIFLANQKETCGSGQNDKEKRAVIIISGCLSSRQRAATREKARQHDLTYLNVYAPLTQHETVLEAEHRCYYCLNTLQRWGHRDLGYIYHPDDRRDHDSHHDRSADAGGVRLRLPPRLG
jgi:hypothetical protein